MSPAVIMPTASGGLGGTLGGLLNKVSIGGGGGHNTSNESARWESLPRTLKANGVTVPATHSEPSYHHPTPSTSSSTNGFDAPRSSSNTAGYEARPFPPPLEPRSYSILKEVGDGSFGTVWLADWHSTLQLPPGTLPPGPSSRPEYKGKQLVAIKRMKKAFEGGWDECMKLKELKSLRQIPMHPNIIPLYDAFLLPTTKELYFVFECMEGNLYQLTKSRKGRPLAAGLTASIFHQILSGLDHIHQSGYFHRDMKPENLLITTTGLADYPPSSLYALPGTPPEKDVLVIVKLADFGLARETNSRPPYTEYVSTRWYRAPEVLLRSRDYSNPVDMWALGTIMVEAITLKPLFPGDSEVDQVYKICEVLGDPSPEYGVDERGRIRGGGTWQRGAKMAKDVGFSFPKMTPRTFSTLFDTNTVPVQLIDCIADLLRYEPKARLTTQQCLSHAYFREVAYRFAPYGSQSVFGASSASSQRSYTSTTLSATSSSQPSSALPSPRDVPPGHGNGTPFKPAFQSSGENGSLPPAADVFPSSSNGYSDTPPIVPRHFSLASSVSGMSGYGVQIMPPSEENPSLTFPENVDNPDSYPSPAPSSLWNGGHVDPHWGQGPVDNSQPQPLASHRIPAFGQQPQPQRRPSFSGSLAASTFYDGSIFEGIAPTRAASIMSFPVGYNMAEESPSPNFPSSPQMSRQYTNDDHLSPGSGRAGVGLGVQAPIQSSSSSTKSRSWGFGSVFSGDKNSNSPNPNNSTPSFPARQQQPLVNPLKRTPSIASVAPEDPSKPPMDPKQRKKELEKAAKEAEKLKREAQQIAARERARAVMKKKQLLMEAADPLHSFSSHARPVEKGKGRMMSERNASSSASISSRGSKMPQIAEDTNRLHVTDMRHKARRRDDDDDVHSVSSNETGHSSQRGRAYSISSQATSASDPERRHHQQPYYDPDMARGGVQTLSSIQSGRHPSYYAPAPSTGHSSLDHQLIKNMQGLATSGDAGWRSPVRSERSESRGHRAASPREAGEGRYAPYPLQGTRSSGQQSLPPIASFDANGYGHARQSSQATQSSVASSIASYQSTPSILPNGPYATRDDQDSPPMDTDPPTRNDTQ